MDIPILQMQWRRNNFMGEEILKEQGRCDSSEAKEGDGAGYQEDGVDHNPLGGF